MSPAVPAERAAAAPPEPAPPLAPNGSFQREKIVSDASPSPGDARDRAVTASTAAGESFVETPIPMAPIISDVSAEDSPSFLDMQKQHSSRESLAKSSSQKSKLPTAMETFQDFLREKEDSFLKAWFNHFDQDQNRRISRREFHHGMVRLGYPAHYADSLDNLYNGCLQPDDEELTFEDIDSTEARLWDSFRKWCGEHFSGARDMVRQLKQVYQQISGIVPMKNRGTAVAAQDEFISEDEFVKGVAALGWSSELIGMESVWPNYEQIIFEALDHEKQHLLAQRQLKFVELEARRHKQKEQAKRKAQRMAEHKAHGLQAMQVALIDFKAVLKKSCGPLFRSWRRLLDPDGSMTVQRADLFKVAQKLNWKGDVRALWKMLDHDGSGSSTLEELDPLSAQLMARFKKWAEDRFGLKPCTNLFRCLDKHNARKVKYAQFVQECQARGFNKKLKTLAVWLDWEDKKFLVEDDFSFLDNWRTPAWLIAEPNPAAAKDFKAHLLHKYGHYLRAWRGCLDKDNSNCCNWHEFQEACRHLRWNGDVAGAWLAFDEDLSRHITLKEIDEEANRVLAQFKAWADEEFGGVRSAFKVLDNDGSGELDFKEFREACRTWGYPGDCKYLFDALDQGSASAKLQYKEISFLDDWDMQDHVDSTALDLQQSQEQAAEPADTNVLLDYSTRSPGPGAYEVLPGFGATPIMPTAKHCGSYSFTLRRPLPLPSYHQGPAKYDPHLEGTIGRKPAWGFSTAVRDTGPLHHLRLTPREDRHGTPRGKDCRNDTRFMPSPGPGSYDQRPTYSGPRFTMRPRRIKHVHPAERPQVDSASDYRAVTR